MPDTEASEIYRQKYTECFKYIHTKFKENSIVPLFLFKDSQWLTAEL